MTVPSSGRQFAHTRRTCYTATIVDRVTEPAVTSGSARRSASVAPITGFVLLLIL